MNDSGYCRAQLGRISIDPHVPANPHLVSCSPANTMNCQMVARRSSRIPSDPFACRHLRTCIPSRASRVRTTSAFRAPPRATFRLRSSRPCRLLRQIHRSLFLEVPKWRPMSSLCDWRHAKVGLSLITHTTGVPRPNRRTGLGTPFSLSAQAMIGAASSFRFRRRPLLCCPAALPAPSLQQRLPCFPAPQSFPFQAPQHHRPALVRRNGRACNRDPDGRFHADSKGPSNDSQVMCTRNRKVAFAISRRRVLLRSDG